MLLAVSVFSGMSSEGFDRLAVPAGVVVGEADAVPGVRLAYRVADLLVQVQ